MDGPADESQLLVPRLVRRVGELDRPENRVGDGVDESSRPEKYQ
ncbi:MAG: hypothetical protein U5R31_08015 [Acidimicrobiia bacterium]|nr:hypothetical protein [Acidimicrobiia bacterium]